MDKKWEGKRFIPSSQETWREQRLINKTYSVYDSKTGFNVLMDDLPVKTPMRSYQDAETMADVMNSKLDEMVLLRSKALKARATDYVAKNYPAYGAPELLIQLYIDAVENEREWTLSL